MTNHRWETLDVRTRGSRSLSRLRCRNCGASKYLVKDGDHIMDVDFIEPCDVILVREVMAG